MAATWQRAIATEVTERVFRDGGLGLGNWVRGGDASRFDAQVLTVVTKFVETMSSKEHEALVACSPQTDEFYWTNGRLTSRPRGREYPAAVLICLLHRHALQRV